MSQVHQKGPVTPAMNITPLIDVVFLLIVFFMLVNNIVSRELVPMIAPDLDHPQTRELGEADRLSVSIAPREFTRKERAADPLLFSPEARFVQVGQRDRFTLDQLSQITAAVRDQLAGRPDLAVVLRADAALYYSQVQPVMDAITAAGVKTVDLVAFMPERSVKNLPPEALPPAPGSPTPGSAPAPGSAPGTNPPQD